MPFKFVSENRQKSIYQEYIIIDYKFCHIPLSNPLKYSFIERKIMSTISTVTNYIFSSAYTNCLIKAKVEYGNYQYLNEKHRQEKLKN